MVFTETSGLRERRQGFCSEHVFGCLSNVQVEKSNVGLQGLSGQVGMKV